MIRFFGILVIWNQWLKLKHSLFLKKKAAQRTINDRLVFVSTSKSIWKRSTTIGTEMTREAQFTIHLESFEDKLFKSLGMSNELQVGDSEFDKRIYLESDSALLAKELKTSSRAREIILRLFSLGAEHIKAEADWFEASFGGKKENTIEAEELLAELATWIDGVPSKSYSIFKDRFYLKALTAEFFFTGIAFYGFFSFIQGFYSDLLLETHLLFNMAVKLTIVVTVLLLTFNFYYLRGSSRSHKLIVENLFWILAGVPMASFYFLSDANQSFDKSERVSYTLPVVRLEEHSHRRRFGRRRTFSKRRVSYSAQADLTPLGIAGVKGFSISKDIYDEHPSIVNVEVRRGYYNQRYITKFKVE